uniref:DUF11 domain-containing protein n=1 Tax=Membranihabitans maritimus TaxID=2904244 RepID=UPI001F2A3D36
MRRTFTSFTLNPYGVFTLTFLLFLLSTVGYSQDFDLALKKELLTDPIANPIYPGDTVDFTITLYNQGDFDADSVEVTDYEIGVSLTYFPVGDQTVMSALGNSIAITDVGDGTYTLLDFPAGDTLSFTVRQQVNISYARTNMNNFAEISYAEYTDGTVQTNDVDSQADSDDRNTIGEQFSGNAVDDEVDEDGLNGGDEDDHDVARFLVTQEFDLALRKELLTDPMVDPIYPGDTVDFTITVFNQGTLMADSVIVTDYELNMGRLEYASIGNQTYISALGQSIDVIDQGDGTYLFEGFLPGDTLMFTVQQRVGADFMGIRLSNRAEISYSVYTLNGDLMYDDIDSYPDNINQNTPGEQFGAGNPASDDEVDENGKLGEDEDDHDREIFMVEQIFDISLEKYLVTEGIIYPGDTVVFGITLVNEGTLSADTITVEELFNTDSLLYVMIGDSIKNSSNGVVSTVTDLGAGLYGLDTLAAGDTLEFLLQMEVPSGYMELTNRNIAYVSNSSNILDQEDIIPDNEIDTVVFDIEQIFDIALRKEINTVESPGPYTWGDTLTFSFTIFNEGTLSADSIVLRDSLPMDLYIDSILHFVSIETPTSNSFENSTPISIVDLGNGEFGIDTLPAMDSVTFDLSFRIDEGFRGLEAINRSEVILASNILGLLDFDSSPNDLEGDDYDSVLIELEPRFDIALEKSIVDTLSSPLSYGDTLVFELTVYNEGNVPATEYDITDSIPSGMAYLPVNTDSNWTYNSVDAATMAITQALNPYEDTTVQISLVLVQNFELEAYLNIAEISAASNDFSEDDEDSSPGNGDREEDDLGIQLIEIRDLALRKVLSSTTPGPFGYGDTLAMEIEVYNQGN